MKAVFGGILLAVGVLLAGASGLCSLAILFDSGPDPYGFRTAVWVIGGIPFLAGIGMVFGGRALLRSARNEREDGGQ